MNETTHCCETMAYHATHRCDEHPDPFDCPDNVVWFDATELRYGLITHDGGSSYVAIRHCPWCGTGLPNPDDGRFVDLSQPSS